MTEQICPITLEPIRTPRDPFYGERAMICRALVIYYNFDFSHAERIMQSYTDGVNVTTILFKIFISYGRDGGDDLLCYHTSMIIDYKKISKRLRQIIRCVRLSDCNHLITEPLARALFGVLTRTIIHDAEEFYEKIIMCCGGDETDAHTIPAPVIQSRGRFNRSETYNESE